MDFGGFRDILCCRYGIFVYVWNRCDSEHTFDIKVVKFVNWGQYV